MFEQANRSRYPTIFALAMDILPIQGSAVPCERVFSSSKETMTPRRSRISPELMEALQILKFTARSGRGLGECLNFTAGMDWADELRTLELSTAGDTSVPEDMTSFRNNLSLS
jgi:hypothetical protein